MRIDFVTLFPEMVLPALEHSILGRASRAGKVAFGATNPRDFAYDPHRTVDDRPFGGGPGMVMRPDVVGAALSSLDLQHSDRLLITDPTGRRFDQDCAVDLSHESRLIFVCGHYEGIDARVHQRYDLEPYSLGDFVLTGGELAALTMVDAIVRLIPGVLGDEGSLDDDSHAQGLLGYPQYTRPVEWEGLAVPDVLLSGNHGAIAKARRRWAVRATRELRPDLFAKAPLSKNDLDALQ